MQLKLIEKNMSDKMLSFFKEFPFYPLACVGFSDDVLFFIFCQSCLETNFGTSEIVEDNLNLFGMKHPAKRVTCSLGRKRGHAHYAMYEESVYDYILYLAYMRLPRYCLTDVDKFANWLRQQNYCPSPTYVDSILAIFNQYY